MTDRLSNKDRQTDIHKTDRQMDKSTDRQIDRDRKTERYGDRQIRYISVYQGLHHTILRCSDIHLLNQGSATCTRREMSKLNNTACEQHTVP